MEFASFEGLIHVSIFPGLEKFSDYLVFPKEWHIEPVTLMSISLAKI